MDLNDGVLLGEEKFDFVELKGGKLGRIYPVDIIWKETPLLLKKFRFRGAKAAMLDNHDRLLLHRSNIGDINTAAGFFVKSCCRVSTYQLLHGFHNHIGQGSQFRHLVFF